MPNNEKLVGEFYNRLASWLILRRAVAAITLWGFIWGTGVLVLRVAFSTPLTPLLYGAIGIPVVVAAAVWLALRQVPNLSSIRAIVDRHGQFGGLLMASAERDVSLWHERMPTAELPQLRWRAKRPLGLLTVALVYVFVAFLLPARVTALAFDSPLDVSRDADRLSAQVRVLKEEEILEADRAEAIQQKLSQLRHQASATDPAKTMEAIDHLNEILRQAAQKAAESMARQSNMLGQVQAAAEGIQAAAPGLDEQSMSELMKEAANLAKKAAAENEQLKEDPELAEAIESGKLSPSQLSKLATAAGNGQGEGRGRAQKLYDAKLIDSDQLKEAQGEGGGKIDSAALAEFLKENGSKKSLREALAALRGGGGKVGRKKNEDEGSYELEFGTPSSREGAKFREEVLPPSKLSALKESQLVGLSKTSPQQDTKDGAAQTGALQGAAASGGSANAPIVLPQHRGAVGRYFDRPAK